MICYRAHCSFQYLCLQYKPYLHTINCFSFTIIELHIFNYCKTKKNLAHTYFNANASAYTLAQIKFSTYTHFKRQKIFFLCLINNAWV